MKKTNLDNGFGRKCTCVVLQSATWLESQRMPTFAGKSFPNGQN